MKTLEQLPDKREKGNDEIKRLFDRVVWGLEHLHEESNISAQLKSLEDDPEQWMGAVKARLAEMQKLAVAIEDSIEKKKATNALEVLTTITGFKE